MIKRKSTLLIAGNVVMLSCSMLLGQQPAPTQQPNSAISDADIQLMRQDLRSDKKQIVAASMLLSDSEAAKFWPVYDQYAGELAKINDLKVAVVKDYAAKYPRLTKEEADALAKRLSEADAATIQLRLKYMPKFQEALQSAKSARFFQVDRRLGLLLDLQLASEIPLVYQ